MGPQKPQAPPAIDWITPTNPLPDYFVTGVQEKSESPSQPRALDVTSEITSFSVLAGNVERKDGFTPTFASKVPDKQTGASIHSITTPSLSS
jgi:hypothetical protein